MLLPTLLNVPYLAIERVQKVYITHVPYLTLAFEHDVNTAGQLPNRVLPLAQVSHGMPSFSTKTGVSRHVDDVGGIDSYHALNSLL